MITVEQALKQVEANQPRPRTGRLPLVSALGRCLAQDIAAPEPSPRHTNSAMDGYAVRFEDARPAASGQPVVLRVAGESSAGVPFTGSLDPQDAVLISTGAVVPEGADTVVRLESTEDLADGRPGRWVRLRAVGPRGEHVRLAGEEFRAGDRLLARGTLLQAPQLALLASLGLVEAPVFLPPRVGIVVTGTELAAPGEAVGPHQIRDSNSTLLAAAVAQAGGEVTAGLRARDSLEETVSALSRAAGDADLLLVSGGVSVGPHDHVKEAAAAAGFEALFWRVLQKPGKPLFVARREETLLFGLPGNPVSAYMCFLLYVRPTILALQGRVFSWDTLAAPLAARVHARGPRTTFVRVRLQGQGQTAAPLDRQGSHMLLSINDADGFIVAQPDRVYEPGEAVTVHLFPGR